MNKLHKNVNLGLIIRNLCSFKEYKILLILYLRIHQSMFRANQTRVLKVLEYIYAKIPQKASFMQIQEDMIRFLTTR